MTDYARALVEHPMWRWEPGMVDTDGRVAVCGKSGIHGRPMMGKTVQVGPFLGGAVDYVDDAIPDLSNASTKGWLLHQLREATGTQDACASWLGGEWRLYGWIGASALGRFATEGEALAAALLAVWGQA